MKKVIPMGNIPILGQRQHEMREDAKTPVTKADVQLLVSIFQQALDQVHFRINVSFELIRMMGATDDMLQAAEKKIREMFNTPVEQEKGQ